MAGAIRNLQFKDGRYYARLAVHKDLQPILGKKEMTVPLGGDRQEAIRKLGSAVAAMRAEIDRAQRQLDGGSPERDLRPALSPKRQMTPVEIAHAHLQRQLDFDNEIRDTGHPAAMIGSIDEMEIEQLRDLAAGALVNPMPMAIQIAYDRAQRQGNVALGQERAVIRALAKAELVALDTSILRSQGHPDAEIPAELTPPARDPLPAQNPRFLKPESGKRLSELLPDHLADRQPTPAVARETEVSVRLFEELVMPAPAAFEIGTDHIELFANRLLQLPVNATKRFPGATAPEAITLNKARKVPYPTLDRRTINDKYLQKINGLLNWCTRKRITPDNPARGIKVEIPKAQAAAAGRVHFAPGDLSKLFARDKFMPKGVITEDGWAYLVALFAGLRPSEAAQMQLDSVRHERGVLCFVVEELTKNEGSKRPVPVHSVLIELGLEKRIAELRKKGETHLFPIWHRDGTNAKARAVEQGGVTLNHFYPRFVPRRFNVTYKKNAGISDPKKDYYSFRHSYKTGLSMAGVSRDIMDQLCGHKDGKAGGVYIHGGSIETLKEAVEKLHFDGFDPSILK